MEFKIATQPYLDRMCEITAQAKRQLRSLGIDQWQKGYPSRAVWQHDIDDGCTYLAIENGAVAGLFAFQVTPDPSYSRIDGAWLTAGDRYASLHRVCVADESKGRGVVGCLFAYGFDLARRQGMASVRIDTHPGNIPMRHALKKAGFQPCGAIVLAEGAEAGDDRIAFEALL